MEIEQLQKYKKFLESAIKLQIEQFLDKYKGVQINLRLDQEYTSSVCSSNNLVYLKVKIEVKI